MLRSPDPDLFMLVKVFATVDGKSLIERLYDLRHFHIPGYTYSVAIIPDFLKIEGEEWERFKSETEHIWREGYDKLAGHNYFSLRDTVKNVHGRKVDDEEYSRSFIVDMFSPTISLTDLSEYAQAFTNDGGDDPENKHSLILAHDILRILNIASLTLYSNLPVYNRRTIEDGTFLKPMDENMSPLFYCALRRPLSGEDYKDFTMNRLRAIKNSTLKKQNFSLLSQLGHQIAREGHSALHKPFRTHIEGAEFNFTGEGSLCFSNHSWS